MNRAGNLAVILVLSCALLVATPMANAQTGELLRAPRVQSRVRVQWDPAMRRIVAAVDEGDRFQALALAPLFLTDGVLAVTYPRLNPLRVGATMALGTPSPPRTR